MDQGHRYPVRAIVALIDEAIPMRKAAPPLGETA